MRYTKDELQAIKVLFTDNKVLMKALRKAFLQVELTKAEDKIIKDLFSSEINTKVIGKTFAPELDFDAPIGEEMDLYLTFKVDFLSPDNTRAEFVTRCYIGDYLNKQFNELSTGEPNDIRFSELNSLPSATKAIDMLEAKAIRKAIKLNARNGIIGQVVIYLKQLQILAGSKDETVEETTQRLKKNSAK